MEFWFAFLDLHRARPSGHGPVGIPLTEIEAWFRLYNVNDQDDRQAFALIIGALDNEWLDAQHQRLKKTLNK